MITLRQLASAAEIALQQTGDDAKINFSQLVFYANMLVNKYMYVKYKNTSSSSSTSKLGVPSWLDMGGGSLSVFPDVEVHIPTSNTTPNIVTGRKYVIIPAVILDIDGDRGIDYVTYHYKANGNVPVFTRITFSRTTPRLATRLSKSVYEAPSPIRPYWYRLKDYIVLLGVEDINIKYVEIGLRLSFNAFGGVNGAMGSVMDYCSSDDTLDYPLDVDEYGDQIMKELLTIARYGLSIPEDKTNDGSGDYNQQIDDPSKIVSVTNPIKS